MSKKSKIYQWKVLSKFESVKIYWLLVKFDWFKYLKKGYCISVKFHWLFQWKLTDLTVKSQITDSISENLTDSVLESDGFPWISYNEPIKIDQISKNKMRLSNESYSLNLNQSNFHWLN